MLEIEMKFAVSDFDAVREHLRALQVEAAAPHVESDHYYNAPDRDFRVTDEAFRLRRVGAQSRITYKGPKQPGPTKTRTEIEVPLEGGERPATDFLRLVELLGYRPTAVVRKTRQEASFQRGGFDLQVCLDDADEIGRFVEVEIVAPPERRNEAQQVLLAVVGELGLNNAEPRSYLRMLLEKHGSDK